MNIIRRILKINHLALLAGDSEAPATDNAILKNLMAKLLVAYRENFFHNPLWLPKSELLVIMLTAYSRYAYCQFGALLVWQNCN